MLVIKLKYISKYYYKGIYKNNIYVAKQSEMSLDNFILNL